VIDLLLGGFFLTRSIIIPKLNRVPTTGLLTVSKCLGEFVPDDWVYWNLETRKKEITEHAIALGIDIGQLSLLKTWCTEQYTNRYTLGYPNVIFDIDTARKLVQEVLGSSAPPLTLLGIGLPFKVSGQFFKSLKPVMREATELSYGVPTILQKGKILPDGGESLGFDALKYEAHGTFHSSKCFEATDSELKDISFNDYGYCSTLEDATKLCLIYSKGSNDGLEWLPWEIRKYPY
jgi:hypothetical protein